MFVLSMKLSRIICIYLRKSGELNSQRNYCSPTNIVKMDLKLIILKKDV